MNQNKLSEAKDCLIDFFRKMNEWEKSVIDAEELYDSGEMSDDQYQKDTKNKKEELTKIFEIYCEAGPNSERLQDEGLSYNIPPEYDVEAHPIKNVSEQGNSVVIETEPSSGLGFRYKYELYKTDSGWKIRDNRMYSTLNENSKWKKDML